VNSLPKIITRQRHGCDLNPRPSAPESSTLTTRLPSHPMQSIGAAYWLATDVAWSVCLLVTAMSCAKMAEPIEMLCGVWARLFGRWQQQRCGPLLSLLQQLVLGSCGNIAGLDVCYFCDYSTVLYCSYCNAKHHPVPMHTLFLQESVLSKCHL